VPVEWDEMKEQLTRLATALGPQGANKTGAVGRLLQTSAANLDGRGPDIRRTLVNMSRALETLSENRGHLFASVRNLQVFTDALADSDATVREFNEQLASVSGVLADDRKVLVQALGSLGTTLRSLKVIVRDHRAGVTKSVAGLDDATKIFSEHRQALADTLQTAPTALSNYYGIYDPNVPAMTGYFTLAQFQSPAAFICSTLYSLGGTPEQCANVLAPAAKYLDGLPPLPVGLNPIQRNGRSNTAPAPGTSGDYSKQQNHSSLDGLAGLVTGGRS
jgi:phospholipid/cholesterol/gamma-HCH transport system substrate-binding protein